VWRVSESIIVDGETCIVQVWPVCEGVSCWVCQVLEKTSAEYSMLVNYVKNTHAATHQQYQLEVQDVSIGLAFYLLQPLVGPGSCIIDLIHFLAEWHNGS